jgi:hypothetical protein
VNVFVPCYDCKNKPANHHEQGNACVAFIYQANQGVAAAQVALGVVKKVKQHHQTGCQKTQVV